MGLLETLIAMRERVVVPIAVFVRGIEKEYPREISLDRPRAPRLPGQARHLGRFPHPSLIWPGRRESAI